MHRGRDQRRLAVRLHSTERFNAAFTVLKNCKFLAFLHGRINCAEIVAPYGNATVTVLRTPRDQT
jgi:hypothetical protein